MVDLQGVIFRSYAKLKERILENQERAKSVTLDKMIKDIEPYVPYKTGALTNSVAKNVPQSSIYWSAPHASYAFEPIAPSGKPKMYDQSVHPKAQGYPAQAAYKDYAEEWAKYYAEELVRGVE